MAIALAAICHSSCHGGSEDGLVRAWANVEQRFDQLATLELEFREAAKAVAGKRPAERLQFAREALDHRYQLHLGLKRELHRFTRLAARQPQPVRLAYLKRVQVEIDKLKAVQAESLPWVKALALDRYEDELNAYRLGLDAELRQAK